MEDCFQYRAGASIWWGKLRSRIPMQASFRSRWGRARGSTPLLSQRTRTSFRTQKRAFGGFSRSLHDNFRRAVAFLRGAGSYENGALDKKESGQRPKTKIATQSYESNPSVNGARLVAHIAKSGAKPIFFFRAGLCLFCGARRKRTKKLPKGRILSTLSMWHPDFGARFSAVIHR